MTDDWIECGWVPAIHTINDSGQWERHNTKFIPSVWNKDFIVLTLPRDAITFVWAPTVPHHLRVGCAKTVFGLDVTCRYSAQTSDCVEVLTPYSTTPSNQFETETTSVKASRGRGLDSARGVWHGRHWEALHYTNLCVTCQSVTVCLTDSLTQVLESVEGRGGRPRKWIGKIIWEVVQSFNSSLDVRGGRESYFFPRVRRGL